MQNKNQILLRKKRNSSERLKTNIINSLNNSTKLKIEEADEMKSIKHKFQLTHNELYEEREKQKDEYFQAIKLEEW